MYKKILNIGVLFIVAVSLCACVGQQGACIAAQGEKGDTGKSAYEIWLSNEHEGSEAEFLDWLRGAGGEQGLSAYEIFKKQYAWYEGDEKQWIDDLVSGKLQEAINNRTYGTFYDIREVYENGWISLEEVKSIVCYVNNNVTNYNDLSYPYHGKLYERDGHTAIEHTAIPRNPERVEAELEQKIKEDYLKVFIKPYFDKERPVYADVNELWGYYGTHNGFIAIRMVCGYFSPIYESWDYEEWIIDDISLGVYYDSQTQWVGEQLLLWSENSL